MKIVLATYIFYPEPIAMSQIIRDMAIRLSDMGHNVTVVTSKPCRPVGYKLPEKIDEEWWNFKRIVLDSHTNPASEFIGRFKENFSFGDALTKYIDENHNDIDVIYACVQPLFCQRKLIKCTKRHNIPVVMHLEDIYPEPFEGMIPVVGKLVSKILMPIDRFVLQNSAKVVAIAPKLREYLIKTRKLDPSKVEYVYNWQDEKRFFVDHQTSKDSTAPFTFMYCGSLSAAANLPVILRSYMESGCEDSRLVFAGSGVMKQELKDIALGRKDIEFIELPNNEIAKIQSQADVMILPLKKGMSLVAFPSKFPAYLFSSKPVIAIIEKHSDVADSIKEASCGWIVEPDDLNEMKQIFEKASKLSRSKLEEMGKSGFLYSQQVLITEVNLTKITNIIVSAVKSTH